MNDDAARIWRLSAAPDADAAPGPLTDADLLALYDQPERDVWIRVNFVASADGSATLGDVSGSLGGDADLRVFDLLRRLADVVLVAAGTVRDEGYGPMRLSDADVTWRRERGMPDHPVFAIVSGSLNIDASSPIFTDAPVRPIVLTRDDAPEDARASLAKVADVVDCGHGTVDVEQVRAGLADRGLRRIHCEGGPMFLGALLEADLVDELCLSVAPTLVGGGGPRIVLASGDEPTPRAMRLAHVLRADDDLLVTRYVRDR